MYALEPTPFKVSKELAKRLRTIRKQLKIPQKEMAERSGVSLGSLKHFENMSKIVRIISKIDTSSGTTRRVR